MPNQDVKMNWFLKLFYTLTGGRPMTYEKRGFTDVVSHEPVNFYLDAFGRRWMANDGSSWFRVRARAQ